MSQHGKSMLRHAATREEYVVACSIISRGMLHRMSRHVQANKIARPFNQAETLKNHHLIMETDFKVIPTRIAL